MLVTETLPVVIMSLTYNLGEYKSSNPLRWNSNSALKERHAVPDKSTSPRCLDSNYTFTSDTSGETRCIITLTGSAGRTAKEKRNEKRSVRLSGAYPRIPPFISTPGCLRSLLPPVFHPGLFKAQSIEAASAWARAGVHLWSPSRWDVGLSVGRLSWLLGSGNLK